MQEHPEQKSWHEDYSSAWVPPYCGMVKSGLQENYFKSPRQVRLLGVAKGHALLPTEWQNSLSNNEGMSHLLQSSERENLKSFLEDLGLLYHKLKLEDGSYLADLPGFGSKVVIMDGSNGELGEYWTTSWDGCYENRRTGTKHDNLMNLLSK